MLTSLLIPPFANDEILNDTIDEVEQSDNEQERYGVLFKENIYKSEG